MTVLSRAVRPLRAARPAVSGRLLLAAAVLVLGGLVPTTASAAPDAGLLVVEGRGGTTMTWVVKETLTVQSPQPTLLGGGDFAGVLITQLDTPNRSRLGAVQVRAFRDSTRNVVTPIGADGSLEPGRYEVVLLGQGPVRATYPLMDETAPAVRVVPRTPLPVRFLGRAETLPAGATDAKVELPGALPAGKRAIQVALRDRTSVEDFRMCATSGGPCSGRLLPLAPPAPVPDATAAPAPLAGTSGPSATALVHAASTTPRTLLWSVDSYYQELDDRLRTAAIVF